MAQGYAEQAMNLALSPAQREENLTQLCREINENPGQAQVALEVVKSRLGDGKPDVKLLALNVLERLMERCRDIVRDQIINQRILHDMRDIVMRERNLDVSDRIIALINAWRAFGGEYDAIHRELMRATGGRS